MPDKPFFSIIIPTYNRAQLLTKAIESVLQQKEPSWELIIIDDGSTDTTKEVVENFQDERIQYVFQENAERSVARNNGIQRAKGVYICFLDSDDYYLPIHLSTFKEKIEKPNSPEKGFYFIDIIFDDGGKQIIFENPQLTYSNNVEWMIQMPIGALRTCTHSDILKNYAFNPVFTVSEDTDVWTQIAKETPIIHIPKATLVVINHDGRTVNRGNVSSFKKNLFVKKSILKRDQKWISQKIRRKVLHDAWFSLAMSYQQNKLNVKMVTALFTAFYFSPSFRWKEKLFMTLSVIPGFLKIRHFLQK